MLGLIVSEMLSCSCFVLGHVCRDIFIPEKSLVFFFFLIIDTHTHNLKINYKIKDIYYQIIDSYIIADRKKRQL